MKKTNNNFRSGLIGVLVFVALFVATPLFAQQITTGGSGCPDNQICNPFSGGNDLNALIVTVLKNIVMPIAGVASVFFIIWAGFQYVLARGNATKIAEANKNLLYALIGVGVLLGAAGISSVVQNTISSLITN